MENTIRSYLKNYWNFSGRATVSEYWYVQLFHIAVLIFILVLSESVTLFGLLLPLWLLFNIIPSLSIVFRRLHDRNRSGWVLLFGFLPYIGSLILLIFLILPGDKDENRYGFPNTVQRNEKRYYQNTEMQSQQDYTYQANQENIAEDEWEDF